MTTYLKSGFAAAVVGLGIFASAGSAYAAGCLTPDQTDYSLSDQSSTIEDAVADANVKGFHCGAVASEYSVQQTPTKVTPKAYFRAVPHATAPSSTQKY